MHVIDSHFVLHILLTAYHALHSQLLRHLFLLNISLTAYHVASYLDNFLSCIYYHCVPHSQLLRQLTFLYVSLSAYHVATLLLSRLNVAGYSAVF